ncbi:MAG: hypothetical protein GY720_18110 [bacterium]|nr:hypothetical protein [bacterium]
MSPEEGQSIVAKWGAWMQKVGPAIIDIGSPLGPADSLVDDGTTSQTLSLTDYSIVDASDMASARQLADGHPYLSEGQGTTPSTSSK